MSKAASLERTDGGRYRLLASRRSDHRGA